MQNSRTCYWNSGVFHQYEACQSRGIRNANKHVLMASLTYNLKKYLRFVMKKPAILVQVASLKLRKNCTFLKTYFYEIKNLFLSHQNFII